MKEREARDRAFAMPLTQPAYPPGPYRFVNREYFIITYRTDPEKVRALVPELLEIEAPLPRRLVAHVACPCPGRRVAGPGGGCGSAHRGGSNAWAGAGGARLFALSARTPEADCIQARMQQPAGRFADPPAVAGAINPRASP